MRINIACMPVELKKLEDFWQYAEHAIAKTYVKPTGSLAPYDEVMLQCQALIRGVPVVVSVSVKLGVVVETKSARKFKLPATKYVYSLIDGTTATRVDVKERPSRYDQWPLDKVAKKVRQLAEKIGERKHVKPEICVDTAIQVLNREESNRFEKKLKKALDNFIREIEWKGFVEGYIRYPMFNLVEAEL